MNYYFIGDSHLGTLMHVFNRNYADFNDRRGDILKFFMLGSADLLYRPFWKFQDDNLLFLTPRAMEGRGSFDENKGRFDLKNSNIRYILSMGFHTQTILFGETWAAHAPHYTSLARCRCAMSSDVFEKIVLDINKHILALVKMMHARGHDIIILEAPPPTTRYKLLELSYNLEDLLAMDGHARRIIRRQFDHLNAKILSPPSKVLNEGLLRPEFLMANEADPHHGNETYAGIFLDRILEEIICRSDDALST